MADVLLTSTEEIIQLVSVSGASQGDITTAVTAHNASTTAHGLNANIFAALTGAASPSAGNVLATLNANQVFSSQTIKAANYINLAVIAAPSAPVAALDATAGNLNGAYEYVVTYYNGTYETAYSAASNTISPSSQRGTVTIPVSSDATITTRRLYRTKAGVPNVYYFLFEIPDNSTTTYADDGMICALA